MSFEPDIGLFAGSTAQAVGTDLPLISWGRRIIPKCETFHGTLRVSNPVRGEPGQQRGESSLAWRRATSHCEA